MKDFQQLEQYALDLGYAIDKTKEEHSGWRFILGKGSKKVVVWSSPLLWTVADVIDDCYQNHRQFKFRDHPYSECDINEYNNYNALKAALNHGARKEEETMPRTLVGQTGNLRSLKKALHKNYVGSGLLVSISDLDGREISDKALINGEYSHQLLEKIIALIHKTMETSISMQESFIKDAKKALLEE